MNNINELRDQTVGLVEEIEYTVYIHDEMDGPDGDVTDPKALAYVLAQIESGNPWAWCVAEVRASVEGCSLYGSAYLGGCSYASEDDFRGDGEFEDLCADAFEDLMGKLEVASKAHARLV